MKNLIRKILKEETNNKFIDKVVNYLDPPYFKNMESLGVTDNEYRLVLSKIFNQPVRIYEPVRIYGRDVHNEKGNVLYWELEDDYWDKWDYDDNGNEIYYENSQGDWIKWEYDDKGNEIYVEDSNGNIRDNRYG